MIETLLCDKHRNDPDQLKFIFSDEQHISVIAPAGCGKTTAMVSKIARELSSNRIDIGKKVLAMTFSVAAAMKINDSLKDLLPSLIHNVDAYLNKIDVANYHSFSMRILYKYGYVLDKAFLDLQSFDICDEQDIAIVYRLSSSEAGALSKFSEELNSSNLAYIENQAAQYWTILKEKLIPNKIITYNGILLAAIELLKIPNVSAFYSKYYQLVIIDEFQDTNLLGYILTSLLINDNRSIFLGDGMQKIYGFIGALPDAFSMVRNKYQTQEIAFKQNYRFSKNESLMSLDRFLRMYGENYSYPNEEKSTLKCKVFQSDDAENHFIVRGIKYLLGQSSGTTAVLVRSGYQGSTIAKLLEQEGIDYFNSLYRDTDQEFKKFYNIAIQEFHLATGGRHKAVIRDLKKCLIGVKNRESEIYTDLSRKYIYDSLFKLLEILFEQAKTWHETPADRYENIDFILGTNGLKHMVEYLDSKVILSTVHSAKGLEWENVIIPYMNSYAFPVSKICKECKKRYGAIQGQKYCRHNFENASKEIFLDEFSVFYVAVTRAREQIYVTANTDKNNWGYYKGTSCFLNLEGLQLESYNWE